MIVRVIELCKYREDLFEYLQQRMHSVAPNLSALIGEVVGARLISHSGSLVNLAKSPASTIQILGAEKALFRALKTRSNTPKYGIIFHSSFIGRAGAKNKGRISRYLANKCSIASRLDSFSEEPTDLYGLKMKEQVEQRLNFYETGVPPQKNADAMLEVAEEIKKEKAEKPAEEKKEEKPAEEMSEEEVKEEEKPEEKKEEKREEKEDKPVEEEEKPEEKPEEKEEKPEEKPAEEVKEEEKEEKPETEKPANEVPEETRAEAENKPRRRGGRPVRIMAQKKSPAVPVASTNRFKQND